MDKQMADLTGDSKRRKFLKQLLSGSIATLAMPALAAGASLEGKDKNALLTAPADVADERYWEMVKKQFTVPSNLIMFNAANLCPSPYFINDLVESTMKGLGKDVSFQYRSQFAAKRAKSLEKTAQFMGVTKEEIGIVRNASEGNSIMVQGFDLKPGEEIILWDQNHPSNSIAWEQKAKRSGFIVKKIPMPASPKSADELVAAFAKAITPKTRMISFSHISNTSGMTLPAKEICKLAKSKNILTMVDGAQSLGMMDLNLTDVGCDFYTASTHKWLMGPLENGILYVKKEHLEKLWPNVISAGWKEMGSTVDEKLCVLGQRNETSPFALPETIDFHLTMGKKNIEDRVRKLNARLKEQIQAKIPQAVFVSPLSSEMTAGITIINLPGKTPLEINQKLYDTYGIACAPSGGVRMSPHIYNTMADVDKVVEALTTLSA